MDPEGVFSARAESRRRSATCFSAAAGRPLKIARAYTGASSVVTPLGPPSVAVRALAKALAVALRPASAHLACSRVASTLIGETAAASDPTATRVSTAAETGLAAPTKLATSERRRAV